MIKVSSLAKYNVFGSHEQGHNTLSLTLECLNQDGEATLDFTGIRNYSSAAVDALFLPLFKDFGKDILGTLLHIEGNDNLKEYVATI